MEKELLSWIQNKKNVLDKTIADAAENFRLENQSENFIYDCSETSRELWYLSQGEDLCYDRPTIAFTYSLWYHGKRVNTFLRYYFNLILQSLNEERIDIVDLGAGTGAVQWAVGIVYSGLRELNIKAPKIRIVNIDSSPFMLHYNQQYLWKSFINEFEYSKEIHAEYEVNSWINTERNKNTNVWLSASYLFDHSENSKEITLEFEKLVKEHNPSKLLLLSAKPKSHLVDVVANNISSKGYDLPQNINNSYLQVFSNNLKYVNEYRSKLQTENNYGFKGMSSWNIDSLYGKVLIKRQGTFSFGLDKLDMYVSAQKDRTKIKLTDEQLKASENTGKQTIIVGPAGCGKSVVLTQRIKNIVEQKGKEYDPNLRILLTTFNKDLVKHLSDWIEQILDPVRCTRVYDEWNGKRKDHCWFKFKDSNQFNIYILHFDILPTKIGRLGWVNTTLNNEGIEQFHLKVMQRVAFNYAEVNKLDQKKYAKILDADFLMNEYQRIIYGEQCVNEKEYQQKERTGRGNNPTLRYNSPRRKIVWQIICEYLKFLKTNNPPLANFTMQRQRFLRKLIQNIITTTFDYILVDEIQDCTRADYLIFQKILKYQNNFILAGDLAQSIHLGSSVHFPTSEFEKIKLKGSFRLPFRISEAIKPLSIIINEKFRRRNANGETEIINPYKGSPPGARPIFVYGKNLEQLSLKLKNIFYSYKIFGLDHISIYESDKNLSDDLNLKQVNASSEIILKTKGLEKSCVLWSTRIDVDTKTDEHEFIYTILTRTTSILIIAVCETVIEKYADIINSFYENPKKLILWDNETVVEMQRIKNGFLLTKDEEEQDDFEELQEKQMDEIISIEELL